MKSLLHRKKESGPLFTTSRAASCASSWLQLLYPDWRCPECPQSKDLLVFRESPCLNLVLCEQSTGGGWGK